MRRRAPKRSPSHDAWVLSSGVGSAPAPVKLRLRPTRKLEGRCAANLHEAALCSRARRASEAENLRALAQPAASDRLLGAVDRAVQRQAAGEVGQLFPQNQAATMEP